MNAPVWPALTWEDLEWRNANTDVLSRRQRAESTGPYRAAIVPAIATSTIELDSATSADANEATGELSRFDAEVGAISAPFASILLRSESASSSQIENLTSGARAIAEAELGERETGNAALIVRNVRAMNAAIALSDHIDNAAIIAMQEALLGGLAPRLTGSYRAEQVWIGGGSVSPHNATFVPPHHERVAAAMDDLVAFVARDDLPVLAQAAVAHAQFETIHPFGDGNGRTGRALVHAILRQKQLMRSVTVPVSAGLLHDVDGYFSALTAYRQGDIQPIVAVFTSAAMRAVVNGRALGRDIDRIRDVAYDTLRGVRRDSSARRLVALALESPVLNQALVVDRLGVTPHTAYTALELLTERGFLRPANSQRRNRIWVTDDVIGALDDFAVRAGKRAPATPESASYSTTSSGRVITSGRLS